MPSLDLNMEYQPLNAAKNEIRVIKLFPSCAWPDHLERICCSLENVSLVDYTPSYSDFMSDCGLTNEKLLYRDLTNSWRQRQIFDHGEIEGQSSRLTAVDELTLPSLWRFCWGDFAALSYTWHDPSLTDKVIYVNGHPLKVTGNLERALQHLRARFKTGLKLWADAICINQNDIAERNLQVRRMGEIFGTALHTVIWLGDEKPYISSAFVFLRELGTVRKQSNAASEALLRNRVHVLHREEFAANITAQVIMCGENEIQTDLFCDSIYELCTNFKLASDNILHCIRFRSSMYHSLIQDFDSAMKFITLSIERLMLLFLIAQVCFTFPSDELCPLIFRLSREAEQSEIKDKVYGILSLLDQRIVNQIVPNYCLSVRQILVNFNKAMLSVTNSLELLRRAGIPPFGESLRQHTHFLPSWAEDLTLKMRFNGREFNVGIIMPDMYHAGGDAGFDLQFSEEDEVLSCSGVIVDAIDGMSLPLLVSNEGRKHDTSASSMSSANAYGSEEAVLDAAWRAFVGNRTPLGPECGPPSENWRCVLQILRCILLCPDYQDLSFKAAISACGSLSFCGRTLFEWLDANRAPEVLLSESFSKEKIIELLSHISYNIGGRKFMSTTAGRVGLAPQAAMQGDRICLLLGCSTPLILRPDEIEKDNYKLVGESYVHDIMEGEVLDWIKTGKSKLETISLC